jgi:putative MFS transporter
VLALMIGLLFVLIVAVMVLGIEPRRRSLEDLGGGDAAEDGSVRAPAIAR